jgi:site-specific DNA-methyltransferase (adenine-specific)
MKLLQGDCLEIMKKMASDSIDCVVCDPPYKTTSRGSYGDFGGWFKKKNGMNGNGGFDNNELLIEDYLPLLMKVMKPNAHAYLMCNNKNLVSFHVAIESAGFKVFKTLIWAKNNAVTNMYYMDSHEYIIFFRKGKAKKINNCGTKSVLYFDNPRNKVHPSEKPVDLLETLIKNSTNENDVVLDFTMGSGSTGIACINTNRQFIGMELDQTYFEIAKKRIEEHQDQAQGRLF